MRLTGGRNILPWLSEDIVSAAVVGLVSSGFELLLLVSIKRDHDLTTLAVAMCEFRRYLTIVKCCAKIKQQATSPQVQVAMREAGYEANLHRSCSIKIQS